MLSLHGAKTFVNTCVAIPFLSLVMKQAKERTACCTHNVPTAPLYSENHLRVKLGLIYFLFFNVVFDSNFNFNFFWTVLFAVDGKRLPTNLPLLPLDHIYIY